ncbi:MAG: RNA-binding protein [Cyanobacteria bacterium P01_G01_bin.49]
MSIYVGNLPYEVTETDLSTVFADYGSVKRVYVPTDRESGRPRGFAFVELDTPDQETSAIETLNGAEWMGRSMKVDQARPRQQSGGSRSHSYN